MLVWKYMFTWAMGDSALTRPAPSAIRIYTAAAIAVESGVNYDTQCVPYKPAIVIPFEM